MLPNGASRIHHSFTEKAKTPVQFLPDVTTDDAAGGKAE
jgi:hypothetical protein